MNDFPNKLQLITFISQSFLMLKKTHCNTNPEPMSATRTNKPPMNHHDWGSSTAFLEVKIIGVMARAPKVSSPVAPQAKEEKASQRTRRGRRFMAILGWASCKMSLSGATWVTL